MIKLIIEIKEDDHQVGMKFETIPTKKDKTVTDAEYQIGLKLFKEIQKSARDIIDIHRMLKGE